MPLKAQERHWVRVDFEKKKYISYLSYLKNKIGVRMNKDVRMFQLHVGKKLLSLDATVFSPDSMVFINEKTVAD